MRWQRPGWAADRVYPQSRVLGHITRTAGDGHAPPVRQASLDEFTNPQLHTPAWADVVGGNSHVLGAAQWVPAHL